MNPITIRGIYYNPIVTSLPAGSRQIALETTIGDVLLGTSTGNTGIGTTLPTAQLHTTGTVRFAGLTNDSTQARVLVSDANGNLYYRSASSLAAGDILRSSLAINGPIKAKSLTLSQTGWPDYVFDSAYRLTSLSEVDDYIRRYNHLPGIPSAAEVDRDGLSIGDNQAALLKKIEELTLYTIDQNKRIAAQKAEVDDLRKEVLELKKAMLKFTETNK
jgi:hypothetical protein